MTDKTGKAGRPILSLKSKKPDTAIVEPPAKSRNQERREQTAEYFNRLHGILMRFETIRAGWPLKIGIDKDILALPELAGIPPWAVGAYLRRHCQHPAYRARMESMTWRYDLSGERAGRITANEP